MPRPLFVALMSVAVLLLAGRVAITIRDGDISDFRCFYEAGRVVRQGLDPYDRAVWAAATRSDPDRVPPCDPTFIYPVWTADAMVPLSLLPERAALAAWEIAALVAIVAGVALTASAVGAPVGAPLLLLTLWSQPVYSVVANAQFGALMFLGTAALALALSRGRDVAGAVAWCVLLLKPHVVALTLAGAIVAHRARPFAWLAAAATTVIALTTLLVAPSWPAKLLGEAASQQRLGDAGLDTFWGLAAATRLGPLFAFSLVLAALVVIVVLLPRRHLGAAELIAILAPVSLVVTPYARTHDDVVLAVPWGVTLAIALASPSRRRTLIVALVLVAVALPWALTVLTYAGVPNGVRATVPLTTALLTVVALRRTVTIAARQPLR